MAAPLTARLSSPLDRLDETPVAFDYDDISLVPRHASSLPHRSDARPGVTLGALSLEVPILGSPMPDVCGPEMCQALAEVGALGILHRFQTVDEEVAQFRSASRKPGPAAVGAALGVTGDYRERFDALVEAGCRIVCLDTANGAHQQVGAALTWARERRDDVTLIAGNVASAEAFSWLEDRGADAIRVGIAGGAVCETRTETGVFVPTPYAVAEAARVRRRALIVGDSGVREPADLCKLLALGSDLVMVGSALAGTGEAPGRVIMLDGKKYKIMRGAASFSVQQQAGRDEPEYVEGAETMVPYKGHVSGVINRYLAGLRSSMSYMNAHSLDEYRANVDFVRLR
jgi:IMP dehydrogenase/GMP reductase